MNREVWTVYLPFVCREGSQLLSNGTLGESDAGKDLPRKQ
jgi:hypothetical protein